ncbi:uncharacterized protein LOC130510404 [Raphanus sativus]|uniref:Uncharacterized protein LOC130510404 n=1 Tax=Raphanus sativus TaxID=3726 RepID=A0A9W3DG96_RAPSA|nr:uncharacterized protein LOC130510404 [Raphanus sativus]
MKEYLNWAPIDVTCWSRSLDDMIPLTPGHFRSFVAQNGLWDLKHTGEQLSWRGNRHTHFIRSRLDRAMSNCAWFEDFPMGRCRYLRFEGSDHRPLVSYFNSDRPKKKGIFRFNRSLTEQEEVTRIVDESWHQSPLDSVIQKLNEVRKGIIKWAKEKQIQSNLVIKQNQEALEKALSSDKPDQTRIEEINTTLRKAYLAEEQFWQQRSRIQWLKQGDRNTGFFHAATRTRRALNSIPVLEDAQGGAVYEEKDITRVISDYFTQIFSTNGNNSFSQIQDLLSRKVTPEMNEMLISIPSDSEIREVVLSINGNKAPGPDGFSATFYQAYWHIVSVDVIRDVRNFFISSYLHPQQNETHIRLIPKITGPRSVADYRPIALCNTHYKIIAKILTRRLKPLLPVLVSNTQSAFVTGRAISDNVLITHETLHFLRTSEATKRCSMAVKTDMSKAYDRIEWSFVKEVLGLLGFDPIWIGWIMSCIESVSYSFLINGSPQGLVKPSRGLRQGDPLSPHIFILCTEVLSALCAKGQADGSLPGVRVSHNSPLINHLLFADDTMFFCKSKPACVLALKKILATYEAVSGQRINPQKSAITFSAKTPDTTRSRVKETLEIYTEGGVGKYLGLPEQFGRRKRDIFASILDRIRQKAHSWKARFLSGAGKQVMLKSVLSAMPCHAMSCFKLPLSLCRQIQSLLTRFWWDANPEKRKMCWVAWDTMTLPKYAGGLGFRDIEIFNDSLLAKIGWRLIKEPNSLLAQVLLGKYAHSTSFMDCPIPSSASHGWRSVLAGRDILRKGLSWAVGNGESIRVWDDPWLSFNEPIKPIGPPSSEHQSLLVCDLLCPITNKWDIEKIRRLLPQYEDLILQIKTSSTPSTDTLVWLPGKTGIYSTKSGYGIGRTSMTELNSENDPVNWLKHVWNIKTGPKLKDFLWRVLKKAIPVSANLERRGVLRFNCKTCGTHEDDLHVFLTCPLAEEVWSLLPIRHRPPGSLSTIAELVKLGDLFTPLPPIGLISPLWPWVLWNLWKARNKLVFENRVFTAQEIILKSIKDAKEWCQSQVNTGAQKTLVTPPSRIGHPSSSAPPTFPHETLVCYTDAAWDVNSGRCDPFDHLDKFDSYCGLSKTNGVSEDALKLRLFPFSLGDKARQWEKSLPSDSITTWDECKKTFLDKFFSISRTAKIRNEISGFQQRNLESFSEAWERFKGYQAHCPHHGFSKESLLSTFYRGAIPQCRNRLDTASNGFFLGRNEVDAEELIENMAKSDSVYSEDHDRVNRSDDQQTKKELKSLEEKLDLLLANKAKLDQMKSVGEQQQKQVAEIKKIDGLEGHEEVCFINNNGTWYRKEPNFQYQNNYQQKPLYNNQQGGYQSNQPTQARGSSSQAQVPSSTIESMFKQILEAQGKFAKDIGDEFKAVHAKIDGTYSDLNNKYMQLASHVKALESQVASFPSTSKQPMGTLPGKAEANPREHCNVLLSSDTSQVANYKRELSPRLCKKLTG